MTRVAWIAYTQYMSEGTMHLSMCKSVRLNTCAMATLRMQAAPDSASGDP